MGVALELKDITKVYKVGFRRIERKAVDNLSFTVPSGSVFGLLGPNGAGKTTTIKMAVGFLQPNSGDIKIFGEANSTKARRRIGFLPEQPYFYPHLTAEGALDFYAKLFGIKRSERRAKSAQLLDLVGLGDATKLPLKKYSKGMLQRFGIAQALINDPDLLIVDEPASGLDPIGQVEMRSLLKRLNHEGKTVLLSSHYLSEVEGLCHEVAILSKGLVVAQGSVEELLGDDGLYTVCASNLPEQFKPLLKSAAVECKDGLLYLSVEQSELEQLIDTIRSAGGHIEDVRRTTKNLEQLFIELIGDGTHGN